MPLALPAGKRLAVSIGADFDAHCLWMGTFGLTSPSYLSRGRVRRRGRRAPAAQPVRRHDIRTTWCTPSHTLRTFPGQCAEIVDAGHEIAAHGCYHEQVPKLDAAEERRLLALQLAEHEQLVGRRPDGLPVAGVGLLRRHARPARGVRLRVGLVADGPRLRGLPAAARRHRRPRARQHVRPAEHDHRDPRVVVPRRLPGARATCPAGGDGLGSTIAVRPVEGPLRLRLRARARAACSPSPSIPRRSPGRTPS